MDKIYILFDCNPHEPIVAKVCHTIAEIDDYLRGEGYINPEDYRFMVEEWEIGGCHISDMHYEDGLWNRRPPMKR